MPYCLTCRVLVKLICKSQPYILFFWACAYHRTLFKQKYVEKGTGLRIGCVSTNTIDDYTKIYGEQTKQHNSIPYHIPIHTNTVFL